MKNNTYRFVTQWQVEGSREEVYRIIEDAPGFVRWWPAVWLRVEVLEPGDAQGIGRVTRVVSKGWLPYILRWTARTVEKVFPERIVVRASGDFEGQGTWTFQQNGSCVEVLYIWEIAANKALLRYLSFLLKPIFSANHSWAMARGEESLRLELARQRAQTAEDRVRIPPPPLPRLSERQRRRLGLPQGEPASSIKVGLTKR
jgi:hypothetical protein